MERASDAAVERPVGGRSGGSGMKDVTKGAFLSAAIHHGTSPGRKK